MRILIDNVNEVDVDNKIQVHERATIGDGQKADVHLTIRLDHLMIEVQYEDENGQPARSERWYKTFSQIAEWLKEEGGNIN